MNRVEETSDYVETEHPSKRLKINSEEQLPTSSTPPEDSQQLNSDNIQGQIEGIITQLNEDREQDQTVMDDMKSRYEELCSKQMEVMNNKLQEAYQGSEDPVNERLTRLNEMLERIRELEQETGQFKEILGSLYRDVANPRES